MSPNSTNDLILFTKLADSIKTALDTLAVTMADQHKQTARTIDESHRKTIEQVFEAMGSRIEALNSRMGAIGDSARAIEEFTPTAKHIKDNLDKIDRVMPKKDLAEHLDRLRGSIETLGNAADLKRILEVVDAALAEVRQLATDRTSIGETADHTGGGRPNWFVSLPAAISAFAGGCLIAVIVMMLLPVSVRQLIVPPPPPSFQEQWAERIFQQGRGMDCVMDAIRSNKAVKCSIDVATQGQK